MVFCVIVSFKDILGNILIHFLGESGEDEKIDTTLLTDPGARGWIA